MITNTQSAFIFSCMKRGDYLPFAVSNMREEFSDTARADVAVGCVAIPDALGDATDSGDETGGGIEPSVSAIICAWCPDFNPRDPSNRGASHTICPACKARLDAELDAEEGK